MVERVVRSEERAPASVPETSSSAETSVDGGRFPDGDASPVSLASVTGDASGTASEAAGEASGGGDGGGGAAASAAGAADPRRELDKSSPLRSDGTVGRLCRSVRRPPAPSVRRPVALGSESLLATASITLQVRMLASVALPPPLPPPPPPPMLARRCTPRRRRRRVGSSAGRVPSPSTVRSTILRGASGGTCARPARCARGGRCEDIRISDERQPSREARTDDARAGVAGIDAASAPGVVHSSAERVAAARREAGSDGARNAAE